MFEINDLNTTDFDSGIEEIKDLVASCLRSRGNKKFRKIYGLVYRQNSLALKIFQSDFSDELIINNISMKSLFIENKREFSENDLTCVLQEVTENDFVLIIPPPPHEVKDRQNVPDLVQDSIKTNLQKNLQRFIEELDKKQTTFMMFYGRLDKRNNYPIFWQWGHVIYLSKSNDEFSSGESLHHLYLSRNLAKLAMTPEHYGRSIQPLFYRIFEVQATQNPNLIAVVSDSYKLTYKQLNEAANKFAHLLLRNGVDDLQKKCVSKNKDCVIVVALERDDPQIAIAKLAIEKIGATYTLFNTDSSRMPLESCIQRLMTSSANFIITYNEFFQKMMSIPSAVIFKKERDVQLIEVFRKDVAFNQCFTHLSLHSYRYSQNLNLNISPQHVLTHAYTSGSTGAPKAARIAARGYPFAVIAHVDAGRLDFTTNTLQFSSVDFDASLLEEKMTWAVAGQVILMNQAAFSDHIKLMHILEKHKINCLTVTPNLLSLLLNHSHFPFISFCLVVGDNVNKELLDKLWNKLTEYSKPFYILVGYGTTQTTIQGSYLIYEKGKPLSLGYPALGVNIELLSLEKLAVVANSYDHFTRQMIEERGAITLEPQVEESEANEEGFICTYGPCNMLGYVGGETVDANVLYNTKDIGILLKSGMKFKRRIGRFFKINGQGGDLSEVESVINEYKEIVKDCRAVIHVRESQNARINIIAVYIVPENKKLIIKDSSSPSRASLEALKNLQSFMREKLPAWKVPALVNMLFVSELLIKNNDKKSFDDKEMSIRWKIPCLRLRGDNIFQEQLDQVRPEAKSFMKIAQQIAADCMNLLPIEVPYDVNLLELGMDSLQSTRFVNRLKGIDLRAINIQHEKFKKALDVLSVEDVKNFETLRELYDFLHSHSLIFRKESDDRDGLIKRLPSKSIEKFMLTDCRIYANESYGEIEETIWWIPSLLGNGSIDYGSSKILQLPLKNHFFECPEIEILKQMKSVDELADYYIKLITVRRGIVFLGGWSSGGWLGKIIKNKLEKSGVKAILFLLDTVVPDKYQHMSPVEFADELFGISNKIRSSIMLLLTLSEVELFNIPTLEGLKKISTKEAQVNFLIEKIWTSFYQLCTNNSWLDVKTKIKCQTLIEHVFLMLQVELNNKQVNITDLNESDILISAEESVARYGDNLGWKISSEVQVEIITNTNHFNILSNVQLVGVIKKRVIKELTKLMEPFYQGVAYFLSGKSVLAIDSFNQVQMKSSGNIDQFYYYRGLSYMNIQSYEKALNDLTLFLKKFPEHINALISRARVLYELDRNIDAANDYLLIYKLTNDPKLLRSIAPFVCGIIFSECNTTIATHKSIDALSALASNNRIVKSQYLYLTVLNQQNFCAPLTKETMEMVNQSIVNDPENLNAYIMRAKIYIDQREYKEALKDLNKAVSLGANKESLMFYYGSIKLHEGDYLDAIDILTKVISQDFTNQLDAYHLRGLSHSQLKQVDAAIKDFTFVIDARNDAKSLVARGNIYQSQGMYEKAYSDFVSAIEMGIDNMMIYYKAALTAKEIIKVVTSQERIPKEEINRVYNLCDQACIYLIKAKTSLGQQTSNIKTEISNELSTMQGELENFVKKYDSVITSRVSLESIAKEVPNLAHLTSSFLKVGTIQKQSHSDVSGTVAMASASRSSTPSMGNTFS